MSQIAQDLLRQMLTYSPESGVFTWRERDRRWFVTQGAWKSWNTKYSGKRAGRVCKSQGSGYQRRVITLLGRPYLEHRLAWIYMTGDPLPEEIDHENRDGTDNRWRNLRASTHVGNMRNLSMSRLNVSGVTGVCWDNRRRKWHARCKVNRKHNHLGYFCALDEAAMAVLEFRADHGFDQQHGMQTAHYHDHQAAAKEGAA